MNDHNFKKFPDIYLTYSLFFLYVHISHFILSYFITHIFLTLYFPIFIRTYFSLYFPTLLLYAHISHIILSYFITNIVLTLYFPIFIRTYFSLYFPTLLLYAHISHFLLSDFTLITRFLLVIALKPHLSLIFLKFSIDFSTSLLPPLRAPPPCASLREHSCVYSVKIT